MSGHAAWLRCRLNCFYGMSRLSYVIGRRKSYRARAPTTAARVPLLLQIANRGALLLCKI